MNCKTAYRSFYYAGAPEPGRSSVRAGATGAPAVLSPQRPLSARPLPRRAHALA